MREGRDCTILCYSRMRYVVMQAVQQLEKQGFDPEARPPGVKTCSGNVVSHRHGKGGILNDATIHKKRAYMLCRDRGRACAGDRPDFAEAVRHGHDQQ